MSSDTPARLESRATDARRIDLTDERTQRAVGECMTVLETAPDLYTVVGEHGGTYTVDVREGRCTCPDAEYNLAPDERCKHEIRTLVATGAILLPAWVRQDALDELLGAHVGGPRFAAADGGTEEIVVAGDGTEILTDDDAADGEAVVDLADVTGDAPAQGDATEPAYTYHTEPAAQGGARYVRCEACGAECVPAAPDRMAHRAGCPEGDR